MDPPICYSYVEALLMHLFVCCNGSISQIWQTSHNAPFGKRNMHTCAHYCYKMVHCEIWDQFRVGIEIERKVAENFVLLRCKRIGCANYYINSFNLYYLQETRNAIIFHCFLFACMFSVLSLANKNCRLFLDSFRTPSKQNKPHM